MKRIDFLHKEITDVIIGCSFELMNELGHGFLESVYKNALYLLLTDRGLAVKVECPIAVMFRGTCIGNFYADLFVEEKVIVELKTVKALTTEHWAQTKNYLVATGIEVGLLINFGNPRVDYNRVDNPQIS